MGFHVEINSILRTDEAYDLRRGGVHPFRKTGSRIFFDDLPIWLTRTDWTARAEIRVLTQTRSADGVDGTFRVLRVYADDEAAGPTRIFRRMFAGGGDPYIYLLMSTADWRMAVTAGVWDPPSRQTDGFIHASPADQLTRVANKHYAHLPEVRVAALAADRLEGPVEWEPATGGLYPHVYGPINFAAADRMFAFPRGTDGRFDIRLPPA